MKISTYEEWLADPQGQHNLTPDQLMAYNRWKIGTTANAWVREAPDANGRRESQGTDPYFDKSENKPIFPNPAAPYVPKTKAELEAELAIAIAEGYLNAKITPFGIYKGRKLVISSDTPGNTVDTLDARLDILESQVADIQTTIKVILNG